MYADKQFQVCFGNYLTNPDQIIGLRIIEKFLPSNKNNSNFDQIDFF